MIQFELAADVPESREVTVTLPPGVPTGRVRLTVEVTTEAASDARKPDPRLPRLQALIPDDADVMRSGVVRIEPRESA